MVKWNDHIAMQYDRMVIRNDPVVKRYDRLAKQYDRMVIRRNRMVKRYCKLPGEYKTNCVNRFKTNIPKGEVERSETSL